MTGPRSISKFLARLKACLGSMNVANWPQKAPTAPASAPLTTMATVLTRDSLIPMALGSRSLTMRASAAH